MIDKIIPYGHQYISDEDIQVVVDTLKSDYLTCGPAIPAFEKDFCEYVHVDHSVAVCNATAALHIAAMALGVQPGDNVICPPLTFAASANCIRFCGGNVKFVDINPDTYLLDIDKLKELLAVSPKGTYKGMVLVDFAGYPFNMEEYRKVADEYGMWILEDACHAPGAWFTNSEGAKVYCGSCRYADITVFSFHPVKHITTGEGGMACTNDDTLYEKMALYRTHGITHEADQMERQDGLWYYEMQELGYNYRLTDFQAALGSSQLKRARHNVELRRELVKKYNKAFAGIDGIKTPFEAPDVYHAYHLYIIQIEDRLGLYNFLRENKIYAQVLYYPLNLMPYYKQFGNKEGDLPVVEEYYKHCLALPMYPTLTEEEQQYIISKVKEFISK
ncbi:UDP-4-amino-4,6-dideoxy-N-acetyl-beta-L-altrosamine transaminase [Bacteroides heparinolyticus]|uniref:UDP-4-amino-4, 6-dideoxy-N-acetyl-beta-L-altrosamine transaminase n=1 Tax=Prevotella heparinolytica TaxID=28113 RepID=UPI0023F75218|nr:UDP-4-amino-4,6-dideoxy-N-acetyl-beta-L-altrosamine transaminase [Bacteroides heparinolyticus]MCI6213163.1 UDP-4-amino-4,6-dideoxy-N-acetyl-beta-L-altrosamine transaminase [Bacteroides heparinolyticus]